MRGEWAVGIAGLVLTVILAGTAQTGAAQCSGLTVLGRVDGAIGNPFRAEVHTTIRHSQLEETVLVARDNSGRVRIETAGGKFKVKEASGRESEVERRRVQICDPVGLKTIELDTLNKTATVQKLASSPSQRSRSFCDVQLRLGSNRPNVKLEDLGHRTIEGIDSHGVMERTFPMNATENSSERQLWCSEELGAVVLLDMDTPQQEGVFHIAMTNIQRAEPSAALFAIPPDYKVLESLDSGPQFARY